MNALKKIQHNCKQATFLIEKQSLTRLSLRESIELRIHLAGCSLCRLYQQQSGMIGRAVQQLLKSSREKPLDETFKQELQNRIDERLNKN
ncbi:hypothetical protein [Hufsiella ginkgonis]|uniref:Zf-HC2 domain-containing protein n=1 Tax=Hufsiella ginkgonis TaxID=2695274 RepID=A0A7K1XYJ1_9SPHI|nr:hypothetical protein [Hufsiella ginkgonis]MXV15809.1 hypothetical protein [Hufsiella ginkgonis]